MTNEQILKDVLESYRSNNEWQSEIAERYHVGQSLISDLLQECGFHYHRDENKNSIDIDILSQKAKVQEICDKIRIVNENK